jgi:hypothetical protein
MGAVLPVQLVPTLRAVALFALTIVKASTAFTKTNTAIATTGMIFFIEIVIFSPF